MSDEKQMRTDLSAIRPEDLRPDAKINPMTLERLTNLEESAKLFGEMLKSRHPGAELLLGIIAQRPDGSGQIGPSWEANNFFSDVKELITFCTPTVPGSGIKYNIPKVSSEVLAFAQKVAPIED